ncbi:MAG TPA: potassium-transporting ATPase subunit KdpC [Chthonomonadaceae bacterium]|nr:potassium-transporting ATPase subunit KdpC [Chthonomonadaceae bacterium]
MFKQLRASIISVLVLTILFGLVFPFVITGISKVLFPWQAEGSLIGPDGKHVGPNDKAVAGSVLIAQGFSAPGYFHPRPSAAGNGYDPTSSGGTNLGPTSDKLINGIHKKLPNGKDDPSNFDGIKDLASAYRKDNGMPDNAPVPADAVTRSASGLDPEISPANADLQVARVAKTRGMTEDAVLKLVDENTQGRTLGFIGEPRVNVLTLNIALDQAAPGKSGATPAK